MQNVAPTNSFQIPTADGKLNLSLELYKNPNLPITNSKNTPLLLFIHGAGEHTGGFHDFFLRIFNNKKQNLDCDFLIYNQRSHGPKHMNSSKVLHFRLDDLSNDLHTVCNFIKNEKELADRKLFLLGNSLGGIIIFNAALKDESCCRKFSEELKITGVILENPFLQPDPASAGWLLKKAVSIFGCLIPGVTVPQAIEIDKITRDPYRLQLMRDDKYYQPVGDFGSAKDTLGTGDRYYFNRSEILTKWPKNIPISLNIGTGDQIVDPIASQKIFEFINEKTNRKNQLNLYDGAYHSLKSEVDEVFEKFVENICLFIEEE